jgi:signal transduction histidine kinase
MAVLIMDLTDLVAQGDMAREFVRQVRHDLRSPLTSMRGAVDLLLSERLGTLDEKQKKLVVLVEKATHSMTAIVSGGQAPAVTGTGQEGGQGGGK